MDTFLFTFQRLKLWPLNRGPLYFTCDGENCIYEGYVSWIGSVSKMGLEIQSFAGIDE